MHFYRINLPSTRICPRSQKKAQAAQAQYQGTVSYKDLYGNTTDLCKMVETNIVLSIKSTYPTPCCILCHFPAFQADSKRFRWVSVIRVSTAKCNERPNSILAMPEARNGINPLKSSLVSQFLHRIKVEMHNYPASATLTQLKLHNVC